MKYFGICVFILLIFVSCGAGKKVPENPKHYKKAVSEIINGNHWYKKGCYERAVNHFYKAHELFTACDYQEGVAKAFNNIGTVYRAKRDIDSAVLFFDESVRISTSINQYEGAVQALSNKAAAYIDAGMPDEAGAVLDQAESMSSDHGITYAPAMTNRGILLLQNKKTDEAHALMKKALSGISPEDPFDYASVNYALGNLMAENKEYSSAIEYYSKALEADRDSNYVRGVAADLLAIGKVCHSAGNYRKAVDYFQRSLKTYTLLRDKESATTVLEHLNRALGLAGEPKPDTSITTYFIKQWSEGGALTSPCD